MKKEPKVPEPDPLPETPHARVGGTRYRRPFNYPGTGFPKAHRPGTKRALVVELLTGPDGATFEEVQNAVAERFGTAAAWDDRTCTEGIRLISTDLGYRLTQDPASRKIRASASKGLKD